MAPCTHTFTHSFKPSGNLDQAVHLSPCFGETRGLKRDREPEKSQVSANLWGTVQFWGLSQSFIRIYLELQYTHLYLYMLNWKWVWSRPEFIYFLCQPYYHYAPGKARKHCVCVCVRGGLLKEMNHFSFTNYNNVNINNFNMNRTTSAPVQCSQNKYCLPQMK